MLKMVGLVLTMALVTYLIRVIPMAFIRKKIKSTYLNNLLYYVPYTVLSAMTFPYILYSTGSFYTALIGTVVALIASVCRRSLIVVAVLACVAVFIGGVIL